MTLDVIGKVVRCPKNLGNDKGSVTISQRVLNCKTIISFIYLDHDTPGKASYYFKGAKGNRNCEEQNGLNVMIRAECKTVCEELGIKIEKLKDNRPCFIAGNNKCRQGTRAGSKASMICRKKGRI